MMTTTEDTIRKISSIEERPGWASLLADRPGWRWEGQRLLKDDFVPVRPDGRRARLREFWVSNLYATQNRSRSVRTALKSCLDGLRRGDWGLNLGSGGTRLHPRVINLDIVDTPEVDIVSQGDLLPFRDETLSLVIAQEVLEHTPDPFAVCTEVRRALKRGGLFYAQVPFQIGWHGAPRDYWRFSDDALRQIFAGPHWELIDLSYSLGYGSGFYRIAVEYAAITASLVAQRFYLPAKAIAALLLIPFRWVDALTRFSPESRRIAAGFYAIARRR